MKSPLVADPLAVAPRLSDWLEISADGHVTVLTGRAELGQGIHAALAGIAAAELGVRRDQVRVAPPSTSAGPNEGYTAGSMSVSAGATALRDAARAARTLILQRAADRLGLDAAALSIEAGEIVAGGAARLALGPCASDVDFSVRVRDVATGPDRLTRSYDAARLDLRDRIVGAPFVQDMAPEGLLHGRVLHPPAVPASLAELDLDALAARPGVLQVVRDGAFVGILAQREWDAVRALDWAVARARWHYDRAAPSDVIAALRGANVTPEITAETGIAKGGAGRRVKTAVSRQYLAHASIGPSAAVARFDDSRLQIWSHTQGVYPLRAALAAALGLAPEAVDVHHAPGPGCYGHNGADDAAMDAALLAAAVPGRPVRVVWSRADEFRFSAMGSAMHVEAEAELDDMGRIAQMTVSTTSDLHLNRPGSGGAPNLRAASLLADPLPVPRPQDLPVAAGGGADRNAVPLYAIPALRVEKRIVDTLPYRTSSMRALGAHMNVCAIETLMDRISEETGADPVQLRLDHLEDPRARAVIEHAARAADWHGLRGGEGAGTGIGFARYKNVAGYCAVVTSVEVDEAVRVTGVHAAVDVGEAISPDGVRNQIEGGILQALSWSLKEAVPVSDGAVAVDTWDDCPILTFSEVPPLAVEIIDRPDQPPLGCGEAAAGPTAAALCNAVANALGTRIDALPLTRDRITRALLNA